MDGDHLPSLHSNKNLGALEGVPSSGRERSRGLFGMCGELRGNAPSRKQPTNHLQTLGSTGTCRVVLLPPKPRGCEEGDRPFPKWSLWSGVWGHHRAASGKECWWKVVSYLIIVLKLRIRLETLFPKLSFAKVWLKQIFLTIRLFDNFIVHICFKTL